MFVIPISWDLFNFSIVLANKQSISNLFPGIYRKGELDSAHPTSSHWRPSIVCVSTMWQGNHRQQYKQFFNSYFITNNWLTGFQTWRRRAEACQVCPCHWPNSCQVQMPSVWKGISCQLLISYKVLWQLVYFLNSFRWSIVFNSTLMKYTTKRNSHTNVKSAIR